MQVVSSIMDLLLIALSTSVMVVAPFTKVEESFYLHAIHDSVYIGLDHVQDFDHRTFGGVVKRSCVPAVFLSFPLIYLEQFCSKIGLLLSSYRNFLISFGQMINKYGIVEAVEKLPNLKVSASTSSMVTKFETLLVVRFFLLLVCCLSLKFLHSCISTATNKKSANGRLVTIWQLMTYSLPHLVFYLSRTLPNVMVLPMVWVSMGYFIKGDIPKSVLIMTISGFLRFDMIVFAAIMTLMAWQNKLISLRSSIINVAIGCIMGGYLSYQLDGYFWFHEDSEQNASPWNRIAELDGFIFNILNGKSEQWGVEPVYAYFVKYLPKIFATNGFITPITCLCFTIWGLVDPIKRRQLDRVNYDIGTIHVLLWSCLSFILVLSLNGHKEWRFLMFTLPVLTLGGASMVDYTLDVVKNDNFKKSFIWLILIGGYILGGFATLGFTYVSSWNYPGGYIMQRLNERMYHRGIQLGQTDIHLDVGTCMNGANLFTQLRPDLQEKLSVHYDKTEDVQELASKRFSYWVSFGDNSPPSQPGCAWKLVDVETAYGGLNWRGLTPTQLAQTALSGRWQNLIVKQNQMALYEC